MNLPPIQSVEDFWGVELSSKTRKLEWGSEDTDDDIDVEKTLELRQACLGASAKEGERNVVQITTENDEGEEVTHTILSMRVGLNEQSSLFLTLRPPVVLELVGGSGPIHIVGQVTESLGPLMDSDTDSSEDEAEISSPEVKALQGLSSKKRPADSPAKKPAPKIAKVEKEESDEDEMDTSEDEEEDDSEEEEDESEEEEEEETKPPPKKQQQTNGKLKGKPSKSGDKGAMFKTPQIGGNKKATPQQRGTQSAPTTPKMKGEKKKGAPPSASTGGKTMSSTAPGALNTDEIKKKLLKMSPNIPKKLEKFNNFVSNSFKVKDDATKKHLWEFVQKNRAEK